MKIQTIRLVVFWGSTQWILVSLWLVSGAWPGQHQHQLTVWVNQNNHSGPQFWLVPIYTGGLRHPISPSGIPGRWFAPPTPDGLCFSYTDSKDVPKSLSSLVLYLSLRYEGQGENFWNWECQKCSFPQENNHLFGNACDKMVFVLSAFLSRLSLQVTLLENGWHFESLTTHLADSLSFTSQ